MLAAEAKARGATQLVGPTHCFQAPDSYRRPGFEAAGQIEGYPAGYEHISMRKRLQ